MIKQVLIAIDQLANTLVGGFADETLSARAWRLRLIDPNWRIMQLTIDMLFFWEIEHCKQSYFAEFDRKHLPPIYSKEQS